MASSTSESDPRKLLQKYRVFLDLNERQAPGHEDLFDDIAELGKYNVDNYRSPVSIESRKRPWGQTETMLKRVRTISDKARRCRKADKNEAGWRLSLESEILSRFDIEVVWLWRAELEVAVTTSSKALDGLAERQQRREGCTCPSRRLGEDRWDGGLNPLFDDRAEEGIDHEEEIGNALKKSRGKKPDRIIGLRATRRIERILYETTGSAGKLIGDVVKTSPFKNSSDPLLYPFLVLEAKSEKSADAFSKIYLQSAFAIRALLNLQRQLLNSTLENGQSGMRPLVWFLANKGEDWRVYGAYVDERSDHQEPSYRILELWAGNITYEDKALALLLIIDHIFDWARDVYRREMIHNLLSLAADSTPSLAADTDVYSTADDLLVTDHAKELQPESSTDVEEPFTIQQLLRLFDNAAFALRDACYMYWDFCGLHITQENVEKLLTSANHPREAKLFSRRLWRSVTGSGTWSVSAACLNAIEELWTGKPREHETFQNPEQRFLAVFFIRSYLAEGQDNRRMPHRQQTAGQWNQHHELTYIAVAEDVLERLREQASFMPRELPLNLRTIPCVTQGWVISVFQEHRCATVRNCLLRAVMHNSFQSCSRASHDTNVVNCFPAHDDSRGRDVTQHFEAFLGLYGSVGAVVIGLPWLVYKRLKRGRLEPDESFLRISCKYGKHYSNTVESQHRQSRRILENTLNEVNAVVVMASNAARLNKTHSKQCIFLLDGFDKPLNVREEPRSIKVLSYALNARFSARGDQTTSFSKIVQKHAELKHVVDFLEDISNSVKIDRHQDSSISARYHGHRLWEKFNALCSWDKSEWSYSQRELMDGIYALQASHDLGATIESMSVAFQDLRNNVKANGSVHNLRVNEPDTSASQGSSSLSQLRTSSHPRNGSTEDSQSADIQIEWQADSQHKDLSFASVSAGVGKRKSVVIDLTNSLSDEDEPEPWLSNGSASRDKSTGKKKRID